MAVDPRAVHDDLRDLEALLADPLSNHDGPLREFLTYRLRLAAPVLVEGLTQCLADDHAERITDREVGLLAGALAALGGHEAVATLALHARTHPEVAAYLPTLGADATPVLEQMLAEKLPEKVLCRVLRTLSFETVPPSPHGRLSGALVALVSAPELAVRLWACAAAAVFPLDDACAVRVARGFLDCTREALPLDPAYHYAARRLAPVLAERVLHESEFVAVRCIEALGWTRHYGAPHLESLAAVASSSSSARRSLAAREAAQRIEHPAPMFRPNE